MLQTARLHLRPPTAADAPALSALMTPGVSRWLAYWPTPFTPAMAAARIAEAIAMADANTGLTLLALAGPNPIGWANVRRTRTDPGRGALGYWLGTAHQGQGYGRELAPAALQAGFATLGLHTIEAAAQPGNAPSLALFRRMGMAHAGERLMPAPARGTEELVVVYEIRRAGR